MQLPFVFQQPANEPLEIEQRVRGNVKVLKALRGLSDDRIARLGGYSSRQVLHNRISGRTPLGMEDLARLACALRVEPHVLLMPLGESVTWAAVHDDYVPASLPPQVPMPSKARAH